MMADLAHPDPQARQAGLKWHQHWVDQAGEAGATAYTGALYSRPGRVERRPPDPDEARYAAENLHQLAEYAARRGVQIVIEPMSRFRTHLINTPDQAVALIRQADAPNLKVLFDTYHAITEVRSYSAAIHKLSAWLWGLHACENDRGAPGGGLVPWAQVFQALREIHFDGPIVLGDDLTTAWAVVMSCSSLSTEQGPAMTWNFFPPIGTPRASTTELPLCPSRLTSL